MLKDPNGTNLLYAIALGALRLGACEGLAACRT